MYGYFLAETPFQSPSHESDFLLYMISCGSFRILSVVGQRFAIMMNV